MTFSRPILIEHELTISEEELQLRSNQAHKYTTLGKDVQNYAKISLELGTNAHMILNSIFSDHLIMVLNCVLGPDAGGRLRGTFTFYNKSANFVKHSSDVFDDEIDLSLAEADITLTDILNPEKKFIEDGKLTIQMKGMLFVEPSTPCNCVHYDPLSAYLRERDDRDFTISVGKEDEPKTDIKIHKLVLASRSPVFDAMLKSGMKESIENKVNIVDFDAEVVQAAVAYCYDEDNYKYLDVEQLLGLLQFADKYDVSAFKDRIEEVLYKTLSPTNICQITNGFILSNATRLKEACLRFMIIYIKQEIPFENAETLDVHITSELVKKASMPFEDLLG